MFCLDHWQVWFQNARAKWRRLIQKQESANGNNSSSANEAASPPTYSMTGSITMDDPACATSRSRLSLYDDLSHSGSSSVASMGFPSPMWTQSATAIKRRTITLFTWLSFFLSFFHTNHLLFCIWNYEKWNHTANRSIIIIIIIIIIIFSPRRLHNFPIFYYYKHLPLCKCHKKENVYGYYYYYYFFFFLHFFLKYRWIYQILLTFSSARFVLCL